VKGYDLPGEIVRRWQWEGPLLRHITDTVMALIELPGGGAIDVGCGTGRAAIALTVPGDDQR
jgi:predicted RNA methylase